NWCPFVFHGRRQADRFDLNEKANERAGVKAMKQFRVEEDFWKLFPEAQLHLVVVKGINNHKRQDERYLIDLWKDGKEAAKGYLTEELISQNSVIKEWREAFSTSKTKTGARSSIEALLQRVDQDRDFQPIHPLVDIYNSISLTYALPCGGEDLQ